MIVAEVVQASVVLVLVDGVEVVAVHLAAGVLTVHRLEVETVDKPEVSRPTFKVLVLAKVELLNTGPGRRVETVDTVVRRVDEVTLLAVVLVLHLACRAETPFLN